MKNNIVQLPVRHNRATLVSLSEKLRGITSLDKADRQLMAANLGRMAASINQANPLEAAKSIFKRAWPNDDTKWGKRKRLLRLPGEGLGNPQDYGTYEAAGAAYLHLAEAVAKHFGPFKNAEDLQREIHQRVLEMLWNTSFRSNTAPLDDANFDARNLLIELANTIESRTTETELTRLWEILKTFPFHPSQMGESDPVDKQDGNFFAVRSRDGKELTFQGADVGLGWSAKFQTEWANPHMQIGWLLKRVTGDMLVLPDDIDLNGMDADNPEDLAVRQIEAWAREFGGGDANDPEKWAYPSHPFQRSLGHGWVSADFDIIHSVEVEIIPARDGTPKLHLSLRGGGPHGFEQIIPADLTSSLFQKKMLPQFLEERRDSREHTVLRGGIFSELPQLIQLAQFEKSPISVYSPAEALRISIEARPQPDGTLGLLDIPGYDDLIDKAIPLAELAHGDAAEILIGSDQYHFVSILSEELGVPVPCRKNSITASLLRNAMIEDTGARISSLIKNKAQQLTLSGLEYHQSVIEFHRDAIRKTVL